MAFGVTPGPFLFLTLLKMKNRATTPQEAEVLNLSESMIIDLIFKIEESIFNNTLKLEELQTPLKEAEELYLPLKNQSDQLNGAIAKEQQTLAVLIGYRDNKNTRKQIRVHRSLSNATPGKRRENLPYTKTIVDILTREDKFLSIDRLWHLIFEENPTWRKYKTNSEFHKRRYAFLNMPPKSLGVYNNKIGLKAWFDNTGTPKTKYLNSLMHAI